MTRHPASPEAWVPSFRDNRFTLQGCCSGSSGFIARAARVGVSGLFKTLVENRLSRTRKYGPFPTLQIHAQNQ